MTQNRSIREHIFYFYKIFLKITRACAKHLVIPTDHTLTANKNLALSWICSISVDFHSAAYLHYHKFLHPLCMFLQQINQLRAHRSPPPLSSPIFPSPPPLSSLNMFCPSIFPHVAPAHLTISLLLPYVQLEISAMNPPFALLPAEIFPMRKESQVALSTLNISNPLCTLHVRVFKRLPQLIF